MKRVRKLSDAAQAEFQCLHRHTHSSKPETLSPLSVFTLTKSTDYRFSRYFSSPSRPNPSQSRIRLLFDKLAYPDASAREDLTKNVSSLTVELLQYVGDLDRVYEILDEKGLPLSQNNSDGSAFVELIKQLRSWPELALEVVYFK